MILLVRHGRTVFNVEGRLQGRLDSPLTEQGVRQARALGALIGRLVVDGSGWTVVSSPLGRARATAEIICGANGFSAPEIDERISEVSFGEWEGLTGAEIDARWPGVRQPSARFSWAAGCPGSETYEDALARADDWLKAIGERNVIAVSHGVTGSLVRGVYAKLSRDQMLRLPVPQDALFVLLDGAVRQIDCDIP